MSCVTKGTVLVDVSGRGKAVAVNARFSNNQLMHLMENIVNCQLSAWQEYTEEALDYSFTCVYAS